MEETEDPLVHGIGVVDCWNMGVMDFLGWMFFSINPFLPLENFLFFVFK
jgi:hypothetical protein